MAALAGSVAFTTSMTLPAAAEAQESLGVAVHGEWLIEIRNEDGTVVSRHAFENALSEGGKRLLPMLLGRTAVPGRWIVRVQTHNTNLGPSPCVYPNGVDAPCFMIEAGTPMPGSNPEIVFANLTVGGVNSDLSDASNNAGVRLEGEVVAMRDGVVGYVVALLYACASDQTPQACVDGSQASDPLCCSFSDRILGESYATVLENQRIYVRVIYTFS